MVHFPFIESAPDRVQIRAENLRILSKPDRGDGRGDGRGDVHCILKFTAFSAVKACARDHTVMYAYNEMRLNTKRCKFFKSS